MPRLRTPTTGITRRSALRHLMQIDKLRASYAAKTAKYLSLAASAKTQPQINAAHAAESVAARAGVRLDAALAAMRQVSA